MADLKSTLFDANSSIGRFGVPQPRSFFTAKDLLAEMDYVGIGEALVYHAWGREYNAAQGNARLMAEVAGEPRLHPCWVVLPHHTGEFPDPETLIHQLTEAGVQAVRIFPAPSATNWSLSDWSAGLLLAALAARHIPLFVSADQLSWDTVDRLAGNYPEMPLVICEMRYSEWRSAYPVLAKHGNLYIELCWAVNHFGLEDAVARFGAERFLFGSRLPVFSAGPALSFLQYSELTPEQRALIAGGNLRRLLAGSLPPKAIPVSVSSVSVSPKLPAAPEPRLPGAAVPEGKIRREAQLGERLSLPIIDAHGHLGAWPTFFIPRLDPASVVQAMDRCGVRAIAVSAMLGIGADTPTGNAEILSATEEFPGRFLGYVSFNPNYDQDQSSAELHHYLASCSWMRGVKIHPSAHQYPVTGSAYRLAFEAAQKFHVPLLSHTWGQGDEAQLCGPRQFIEMAQRFPSVPIILGHSGGVLPGYHAAVEAAKECPNIYLETCGSFQSLGVIEYLVGEIGADRVLYGSDACFLALSPGLGRIAYARLSCEEKSKILAENASRLFHYPI